MDGRGNHCSPICEVCEAIFLVILELQTICLQVEYATRPSIMVAWSASSHPYFAYDGAPPTFDRGQDFDVTPLSSPCLSDSSGLFLFGPKVRLRTGLGQSFTCLITTTPGRRNSHRITDVIVLIIMHDPSSNPCGLPPGEYTPLWRSSPRQICTGKV